MKYIIAAVLSAILIQLSPAHINNSVAQPVTNKTVGQSASKLTTKPPESTSNVAVTPKVVPQPQPTPAVRPVAVATPPTTEQEAKAFIYLKESGNRPHAKNSIGCYGLGQDCNGIVERKCGADYSCQDHFFTDYMLRRYGTWQAAKSFWLNRTPINGRDVGHWW